MKNAKHTEAAVEASLTTDATPDQVQKADANETAAVAAGGAATAPAKAAAKKNASKPKGGHRAKQGAKKASTKAKVAKTKHAAEKHAGVPHEFSKKAIVIDLLRRKQGATLAEIAAATSWQNHSIRGFISGTLGKKMDLPVESFQNAAGERTYRIAK